jgi:hypothetical protein
MLHLKQLKYLQYAGPKSLATHKKSKKGKLKLRTLETYQVDAYAKINYNT